MPNILDLIVKLLAQVYNWIKSFFPTKQKLPEESEEEILQLASSVTMSDAQRHNSHLIMPGDAPYYARSNNGKNNGRLLVGL